MNGKEISGFPKILETELKTLVQQQSENLTYQVNSSFMAQQLQQKQFSRYEEEKKKQEENGCPTAYPSQPLKVPHPTTEATFTVPDDGLGYDDGVRVLRTLGSWTPEYPGIGGRTGPGMLFPDLPYHHDMSGGQRKPLGHPGGPPAATPPVNRPPPTPPQPIKKEIPVKANGITTGNKSFTCTICGKSLARKDKLVIHTRIHTGEKPYVCEVCDKAFARRDKLVIHMNKMKHRTPSNVAPLGKRNAEKPHIKKEEEEPVVKPPLSLQSAAANWSCELCGQMMTTREEWMVHAKAHLEEKITGIGVIGPNTFGTGQRPSPGYNSPQMGGYAPSPQPTNHYQPFLGERQYCPVCRQTFPSKAEFMLHVRAHFDTVVKHEEGSMDGSAICSS